MSYYVKRNKNSIQLQKRPTKQSIRQLLRQKRAALSADEVKARSRAAINNLLLLPGFMHSKRIGIYYPIQNELSPLGLLKKHHCKSKKFYFPVIVPLRMQPLLFAPLGPRWVANKYRIPEPAVAVKTMLKARSLDVLLVPLLAFDLAGNRMGFGAGYYDRTLAYLLRGKAWRKPGLIGFAYAFQQQATLPADPWDIKLPVIVTEHGTVHTQVSAP